MSLTRLMGYHVKETAETQVRLAKLYHRMYFFVQLPTMVLAVVFGFILWTQLDLSYRPGWFHMKVVFALGLVACDLVCMQFVKQLGSGPDLGNGKRYKMLHGITGLLLILVLVAGVILRDKTGEILHRYGVDSKAMTEMAE
ncbi:hypothetical protein SCG7086_CK_00060 [Chlamydiales bacterium SCGC AG-110-P3]|nr:hypothetical protein SCG7086_CK_00060 [Chlamydiales bacterium SCGC AG-110-P3]